jgi:hypothetical protein
VNTGTPWTAGTANPAHIGTRRASGGGLRRARCVATRTAGSEVRAGETGRWQRRHRAPARPYVRHEVPLDRVEVQGLHRRLVAAGR